MGEARGGCGGDLDISVIAPLNSEYEARDGVGTVDACQRKNAEGKVGTEEEGGAGRGKQEGRARQEEDAGSSK